MPERDVRWENVYASITHPEMDAEELKEDTPENWILIRMDVRYKKRHYWNWQQLHKDDIVEIDHPNIWGFILDAMVDFIDAEIKDWEDWEAARGRQLLP